MTNLDPALAKYIEGEWEEVVRVMSIAEGDGFVDSLSGDFHLSLAPAEPRPMPLFRYGDVIYSREPSTGTVLEARHENGGTMQMRVFAPDGSEVSDVQLPTSEPQWN